MLNMKVLIYYIMNKNILKLKYKLFIMLNNLLQNINNLIFTLLDFLSFRKPPLLNNDIENCFQANDDTTTYTE